MRPSSCAAAPPPAGLIRRYDVAGPRYTSYPTADRFVEAFTADDYRRALAQRSTTAAVPLSLYVHVPFCESLCYYCACNKIITRHHERGDEYLRYLAREVELVCTPLGTRQQVSQLHLGGGSPTFLSDAQLRELMAVLRERFSFTAGGEHSIEVDPRTVDAQRLRVLADLGFNRLSFGVQDFDPDVQKAVHRIQPAEQVFALMQSAREIGFESINVDLIHGLPLQTQASFERTLAQVVALAPDRIALYAYAHLPQRFKPQRRIAASQLPGSSVKVGLLHRAQQSFAAAGYVHIGMDHFARPEDALAVAKRQGRLHRNFQGYSTQPDCDLIGLGVSAIGKVGATYSQNAKTLDTYFDALDHGQLPVVHGLALTRDDLARRAIIMSLMCQGSVEFESIELAHLMSFRPYFAKELQALHGLQESGLVTVTVTESGIEVTAIGWTFIRAIAMTFDRYLQADLARATFSRIL